MVVTEVVDQGGHENEVSWSELPEGIISEIFSRLYAGDRVMFRCVCKSWNLISTFTNNQKLQLGQDSELSCPYLMFSNSRIFCPIYEQCYHMGSPNVPLAAGDRALTYEKFHDYMDFVDMKGATIRAAKNGWLLMTMCKKKIFFFNPFTKEEVHLPDIDEDNIVKSVYFSSTPTSTDWIVVAATNISSDKSVIITLKCGENSWSSFEFAMNYDSFELSYCNGVVFEGLYYFLGIDGKLLIHDPVKREFHLYNAQKSIQLCSLSGEQYMLVSGGKILAVFEGCDGKTIHVFQWNHSKRTWETLTSLGDRMLFVSRPLSLCLNATIRGTGNKIYFPRLAGSNCLFYSLTTKKFHTFAMDTTYGTFFGSKEYIHATWMA